MKRFIGRILLYLFVGALLYPPCAWLAGRIPSLSNVAYLQGNYGHAGRRLAEADALRQPCSLLFIGSSHCYRTFDTRLYPSSFNLGSSNQTPLQSLFLLRRYLPVLQPGLVVFEVHPDIMEHDGVESSVDLLSNTYADLPLLRMVARQRNLRTANTMACALFDRLVRRDLGLEDSVVTVRTSSGDSSFRASFAYVPGGFVEVSPYCYRPQSLEPRSIETLPEQLDALADCLALMRAAGVPCLLVEVPASRSLYNAYLNHDVFERQIRALADGYGARYINLNNDTALTAQLDDSSCFFDDDHLNRRGVSIFNAYFKSCILSD